MLLIYHQYQKLTNTYVTAGMFAARRSWLLLVVRLVGGSHERHWQVPGLREM